jgi:hypothetical protein
VKYPNDKHLKKRVNDYWFFACVQGKYDIALQAIDFDALISPELKKAPTCTCLF